MVIVLWWLLACKRWEAEANRLLLEWVERTGRVCPSCGEGRLVGHGRRKRTVHSGGEQGPRGWRVCRVWTFEVQRVRCRACGRTHTLLPAFLARYQRHPNRVRQAAVRLRESGASWRQVVAALQGCEVPLGTTASARRWVAGVRARMGAAAEALARQLTVADGRPAYGSVAPAGSWAAFADLVRRAASAEGWPEAVAGAELAAVNRLGRGRWAV